MFSDKNMIFVLFLPFLVVSVSGNLPPVDRSGCPPKYACGHHEHFEYESPRCRITCDNRVVIGPDSLCVPYTGCVCDYGYVRLYDNGTGPCISEDECPPEPIWCGPNEIETDCETICPPQTCDTLYIKYICVQDRKFCRRGCDCKPGYLRNSLGICIPKSFCPKVYYGHPHSPYYGAFSPHNHDVPYTYFAPLTPIPETSSSNRQSTSVSSSSSSISESHSSTNVQSSSKSSSHSVSSTSEVNNICKKPNEIWHICPPICLIENCDDVDCAPKICIEELKCRPRCICIDNYYRNASGICVHVDDCPYYEY